MTKKDAAEQAVTRLLAYAKRLARRYYKLTGRPLGITGEVAEFEAVRLLRLRPAPVRQPGYDALGRRVRRIVTFIPQMTVAMLVAIPFAADYDQLEKEPLAWAADVKALKTPVLIISGDAGDAGRALCLYGTVLKGRDAEGDVRAGGDAVASAVRAPLSRRERG